MNRTFDRETLTKMLHNEILSVTFTKKDGTDRVMRCTLQASLLPAVVVKEGEVKKTKKVNEDVLAVYDLDKKAFRSFRIDSIKDDGVVSLPSGKLNG